MDTLIGQDACLHTCTMIYFIKFELAVHRDLSVNYLELKQSLSAMFLSCILSCAVGEPLLQAMKSTPKSRKASLILF